MAPAGAAVALAAAVCLLLVPDAVDREAAAEPLRLTKPVADADLTTTITTTTVLAVPEEEGRGRPAARRGGQLSSLLCLVFRCEEPSAVAVRTSGDSQDDGWWPRPAWTKGGDDDESDSDSDCESDSDDDDEGGVVGWFRSLAHRF
uniref:Secreted protein n=1 Tax=Oryza brachyantha TaxID=4533 RepID=J3KXR1_ORYBR